MAQTARMLLSESLRRVEAEIAAGHPDLALARCQELQTLYPRALPVYRVLGEVYLALRKPREALGALDRALGGDPEDARACCARAIVHQMHGDSLAALAWYRRACDIRPDDTVLRSTYAELASHLGQPPYRPTPVGLARLYLRGGLYTHAIREWEMLTAEYPDLLEAQVGLAETLWRAQQSQKATERCRRILANAPFCVKALLLLAVIAHDSGNEPEAQRLIQRAAELDPDHRIAQTLFADRLAAGDTALRRLVLGDEHAATSRPQQSGQLAGAPGYGRSISRPVVRPLTGRLGDRRPGGGATGSLAESTGSQPLSPLPSRSAAVQPDSRSVLSEADYMIWGPDDEGRPRPLGVPPSGAAPPSGPAPIDRAPRSQPLVPPVLSQQGAVMDETEERQAIDWVHWLQAQGARVHPGALAPAAAPQPPIAAGAPPAPPAPPAETTGTPPPPTPEDLRSMFAELAPNAGEPRHGIVEADIAIPAHPSEPATDAEPEEFPVARTADFFAASPPPAADGPWYEMATERLTEHAESPPDPAPWSNTGSLAADSAPETGLPEDTSHLRDTTPPLAPGEVAPDATLEALEHHFAASGFQSFEPHPGALAELAGQAPSPAPASPPPPAPAEPLPAPDDYPARLERARQLRSDGRTDEALVEYRAVLKNAPDLLDSVLEELNQLLATTPEHPDVHRVLGDARIRQGDYLGALESYNRAVALTPASDY